MSATITVQEAQARLKDLIHQLALGEEVIITENEQPIARLIAGPFPKARLRPPPGLGKGMITIVSDDDEYLKDFAECMP